MERFVETIKNCVPKYKDYLRINNTRKRSLYFCKLRGTVRSRRTTVCHTVLSTIRAQEPSAAHTYYTIYNIL